MHSRHIAFFRLDTDNMVILLIVKKSVLDPEAYYQPGKLQ